jgi:signal transduction histidine kinase
VLDVTVSLAEVDRGIARTQARMALLAVVAIAASSGILWWLNRRLVVRPVETLVAATRRVAAGDLTTTIPVTAHHELGDLARSFNDMMRHLSEARRQVTQADKLASVGRLAAGVAHEINNPLTGVLTYASFLLKRAEANTDLHKDLEVIVRETMRCRDIVKGMLDFARQTPPRRHPVDLNEVARRAVAVVMNQLSLSRVALTLDLAPDLPDVSADSNQMQQVIVNLLLNAADAIGSEGGTIRLASHRTTLPPSGNAPIRRAFCPRGCDLLDPVVRIRGLAAIHVNRASRGRDSSFHLDPVYGRVSHISAEAWEEGVEAICSCPRCRTSLIIPDRRCTRCGASVFAVETPGEGRIEWCTRKGCHWSWWASRESAGDQPVVELQVEDSGCGISAEDQQHLFEPFFSTKGHHGTGLGLAVTWGIVESHGGTIDVSSEVDHGSRFTVRLPLAMAETGGATQSAKAAGVAGRADHA